MNRIFFFSFLILFLGSCNIYKDVEVYEIKEVEVTRFDQDAVEAEVKIILNNPNWYRVTLVDSDVDVYMNGKKVGKLNLKENVILPNNTVATKTVLMTGDYDEISGSFLESLLTLLFSSTAKFEVIGTMKGRALMISRSVEIHEETEIDLRGFK